MMLYIALAFAFICASHRSTRSGGSPGRRMTSPPDDDPYRGLTLPQYIEAWEQEQAGLEQHVHDTSSLDEARRDRDVAYAPVGDPEFMPLGSGVYGEHARAIAAILRKHDRRARGGALDFRDITDHEQLRQEIAAVSRRLLGLEDHEPEDQ